ncbi:MAG: tetratricopeptide repeat protein [Flammeovirgaceae bacterium]
MAKRTHLKIYWLLLCLLSHWGVTRLHAQDSTRVIAKRSTSEGTLNMQVQYNKALTFYEQGNLDEAHKILDAINTTFLEKNLKGDVFLLLTKVNILRKDNTAAMKTFKSFLALRPTYKPLKDDLKELSVMLKQLHVLPRFTLELEGGINQTSVNVQQRFNVFTAIEGELFEKNYLSSIKLGPAGMLLLGWRPFQFLKLGIGVGISSNRYDYDYKLTASDNISVLDQFGRDTIRFEQYDLQRLYLHDHQLTFLQIPISIRIDPLTKKRIRPFVELGATYQLQVSALKNISIIETNTFNYWERNGTGIFNPPPESITQETTTTFDIATINNPNGFNAFAGVGMHLKIAKMRFETGIRQNIGLSYVLNREERFRNNELVNGYFNVEDDIKLNTIQVYGRWIVPLTFKAFQKKIK